MEVEIQNILTQKIEFKCKSCFEVQNFTKAMIPQNQRRNWNKQSDLDKDFFTPLEIKRNWLLIGLIYINHRSECCHSDVTPLIGYKTPTQFFNWYYRVVRPPKTNGFINAMREVRKHIDSGSTCELMFLNTGHYIVYKERTFENSNEEFIKYFEYTDPEQVQEPVKIEPVKKGFLFWCKIALEIIFVSAFFYSLVKFLLLWA